LDCGKGTQHEFDFCIDGHGTLPWEQKTQQCPAFGRIITWHLTHSWKKRQASTGIIISAANPHCGHRSTDEVLMTVIRASEAVAELCWQ
jgi:hypothetical protein